MRIFWGTVLIVLGTLFALQSFGVLPVALPFWSVVLTIVAVYLFFRGLVPGPFSWRKGPHWVKLSLGAWLGGIGVFDILHANQITGLAGRDIWSAGWFVLLIGIGLALIFGNGRFEIRTDKGGKWDRWGGWRSRWNWVFGPHDASTVIGMGDLYYGRKPWALDGDLTLRHRAGDVRIDLTTAEIKDGSHRVELAVGAGDVVVLVPDWCSANVRATVGVGNLDVFDEVRQGLKVSMEKSEVVPDATVTLHIDVRLGAGNLEVRRVPSRRVEG